MIKSIIFISYLFILIPNIICGNIQENQKEMKSTLDEVLSGSNDLDRMIIDQALLDQFANNSFERKIVYIMDLIIAKRSNYKAKARYLIKKTLEILSQDPRSSLNCAACKTTVQALSRLSKVNIIEDPLLKLSSAACTSIFNKPKEICSGSHKVFADIYLEVLQGFNLKNHLQSQMVCYTLGNICPFPNLNLKELKLPEVSSKPKVINESNKTDIGYILHISDLHYDENYIEGSETDCSEPICCQVDSKSKGLNSNKIKKPASKWGDYKCDSNINMLKSMFKAINELNNSKYKLDMVIFNGDIPAHDFWKHNLTAVTNTEIKSYKLLNFSDVNVYPTIGNHEVLPNNFVPLNLQISNDKGEESEYYFYRFVAEQWSNWLPKKSINDVRKGGYYSVKHANNLKLINLNNNLCYVNNFYLLLNFTHQNNPNNMLKWLINELKDAEDNNMNVYILSHIPPNSLDCLPSYSMQYYQILNRFHLIIKGQFYGHDHHDEFSVYYDNNKKKTSKRVISNQYLTPSITTLNGQNPGFRIYKVDKKNWEILDYYQYYTQLKDSHMYKEDLEWKLLYTAKGLYDPNNDFSTLSPEFWHNSIVNLSKNQTLFDLFYGYRNKLGLKRKKCNSECRSNYICSMMANHSKDTCIRFKNELGFFKSMN